MIASLTDSRRPTGPERSRGPPQAGASLARHSVFIVKESIVSTEPFDPNAQPGVAQRAIDTATDVSRTLGEVAGTLRAAVDRLTATMEETRGSGNALSTVGAIAREAPLASLFVAFLVGIAVARRH